MHARHHARGWEPDVPHPADRFRPRPAVHVGLPAKVDLRTKLPAAWNQGVIQSCTAHAVGAALWVLHPGVMPSRLALYWFARAVRETVPFDSGAMLRHAVTGLMQGGLVEEAAWRYAPVAPRGKVARFPRHTPPVRRPPAGRKVAVAPFRVAQELRALQSCLADGYPVAFGVWVHASFKDRNGRWRRVMPVPRKDEAVLGGHAVAAVGYDDARRAFLIRNSWGPGVQERGHFWMPYAVMLDKASAMDFWTLRRD